MGRAPCCDKANVKKGPWSPEEDAKLKSYIEQHGTGGNWIALPQKIGLKRCGKSCRLRWLNYLRPNIKHGGFTEEEENIICSLYINIGSRWSIIAAQLPGRTDNDIKNYWNTRLKKKLIAKQRKEQAARHIKKESESFLITQTPTQLPYWADHNPPMIMQEAHHLGGQNGQDQFSSLRLLRQFSDDSTQMVVNGMNYQNYPIQDQIYEDNSTHLLESNYYANLPSMEYDAVNGGGLNFPAEVEVYLSNLLSFEGTESLHDQVGNSSSTSNSAGSSSWGEMSSLVNTPVSSFIH